MTSEEKFSKELETMREKMAEKMIEIDAEKIVHTLLILEIYDAAPPIKTNMATSMEKLILDMIDSPITSQEILKRAIQKWASLPTE